MTLDQLYSNWLLFLALTIVILYSVYYSIFSYFTVRMRGDYDIYKKNIGRSLPPYPNGWYIATKSKDLSPSTTKTIDIAGQNITIFRSPKGAVYALHSYCAHMGANLSVGGQVVNETCIQCPFHGWLFSGETG
jgi:nitrite reductase/ring-hydroxylating ferredoxin subunit